MLRLVLFVFAFSSLCFVGALAAPENLRVTSLPDFDGNVSDMPPMYSGYITINETEGRNLFFFFAYSQGNPSTDPVVLWQNGGPGCSRFVLSAAFLVITYSLFSLFSPSFSPFIGSIF